MLEAVQSTGPSTRDLMGVWLISQELEGKSNSGHRRNQVIGEPGTTGSTLLRVKRQIEDRKPVKERQD